MTITMLNIVDITLAVYALAIVLAALAIATVVTVTVHGWLKGTGPTNRQLATDLLMADMDANDATVNVRGGR